MSAASTSVVHRSVRDGSADHPLLAILHQSPLSSWTQAPLLEASSHPGPVAVFDTPGFGRSAPLDVDDAPLEAYAARLWQAIDELAGPAGVVVMGQHTGALIALVMAVAHPDRVRGVVFQGLPLYTDEERAGRLAGYLPDLSTRDDGTHLTAIWDRVVGLYPAAGPALWDRSVVDYLQADPDYAAAYRAVFRFDAAATVAAFAASDVASAVICGAEDLVAWNQDRVADAFGSEVVLLPGLTDFASVEDPAAVAGAVDSWWQRVSSPS